MMMQQQQKSKEKKISRDYSEWNKELYHGRTI